MDEISCGFAVFSDFLSGFSVSNIPLRPPQVVVAESKTRGNKKLFRAYNRAFTKSEEAGLERTRFYFCRYVVAINEKVKYRLSVCVSDYNLCIAWV